MHKFIRARNIYLFFGRLINIKRNYYLFITFLFGFFCLFHFFNSKSYYPYSNYPQKNTEQIFNLHEKDTISKKEELLLFLFNNRKEHYFKTIGTIGTSVNSLALLSMLAVLLLYFQPADIQLFGVKIPNLAVYIILPICILYYWLLFGFSLYNATASRESLFHLSYEIEKSHFPGNNGTINLMHDSRNILEDISIIDAWSNVFFGFYENDYENTFKDKENKKMKFNYKNPAVVVGLLVIFGGLEGLSMTCAMSMIFFYRNFVTKKRKRITMFFEVFIFSYFLLSHIAFFFAAQYSTLYLASIWLFSFVFFAITLKALDNSSKKIILLSK